MSAHCAPPLDQFVSYCAKMRQIYGKDVPLMSRAQWDAACCEPRGRRLSEDELDDNYEGWRNGNGPIY